MPTALTSISFAAEDLATFLDAASREELDALDFGVIGFDAAGIVRAYNRHESREAGLSRAQVVGRPLFAEVAPCMNNFLVAQRFDDAAASASLLDATIDYVLTLRMRPVAVRLRLLAVPGHALRHVLIRRRAAA